MAAFGLGCSASRPAADQHFDALKSEINRLQADQDRLLERVEGLEAKQSKRSAETAPAAAPAGSERPSLRVVVLSPQGEPEAEPDVTESPEADDAPRTNVRVHGNEEPRSSRAKKDKDPGKPKSDAARRAPKE